jgi:hypothetical protein
MEDATWCNIQKCRNTSCFSFLFGSSRNIRKGIKLDILSADKVVGKHLSDEAIIFPWAY